MSKLSAMFHFQVRLSSAVFGIVHFESVYADNAADAIDAALELNPGYTAEFANQALQ